VRGDDSHVPARRPDDAAGRVDPTVGAAGAADEVTGHRRARRGHGSVTRRTPPGSPCQCRVPMIRAPRAAPRRRGRLLRLKRWRSGVPTKILTQLGVHVYFVPGFHEDAALVRDLDAVFIRAGLAPTQLRVVVNEIMDALLGLP